MTEGPVSRQALEFHWRFGYPVASSPGVPEDGKKAMRLELLGQEHAELQEAIEAGDLLGVARELADLVYVAYGLALTYGIPLDEIITEIHRANMTKEAGTTGKAVKGAGYEPADVEGILTAARGAEEPGL